MSPPSTERELLDFALAAAGGAGRVARRYFRTALDVEDKGRGAPDPVTEADREIESYLRRKIRTRYPDHGITGEEHGAQAGGDCTWVLDPVDGTRGFISGSPMWGILMGLLRNGRPVLGLMHQPLVKETYYAGGGGAWLRRGRTDRPLATRGTAALEEAFLYCTHPGMFAGRRDREAFRRVEERCRYSRYGADCYGYCLLAAGHVDLVIEGGLQPYDIIPLVPIIESAGGVVTDWAGGSPLQGGRILAAANRRLHREAMAVLGGK